MISPISPVAIRRLIIIATAVTVAVLGVVGARAAKASPRPITLNGGVLILHIATPEGVTVWMETHPRAWLEAIEGEDGAYYLYTDTAPAKAALFMLVTALGAVTAAYQGYRLIAGG